MFLPPRSSEWERVVVDRVGEMCGEECVSSFWSRLRFSVRSASSWEAVAVGDEDVRAFLGAAALSRRSIAYTTHLRCSCHHLCDDGGMERGWPRKRSHTILGSSLAFVIGATIMIFLHETAHAVTGALQGYHPTQLAFAVDYTPPPPTTAHVIALLAGPAFSLLSGVAGIVVDRFVTPFRDRPFWRLVWLWTLFASVQEGLGYLQITAILQTGDTAQAFDLLEASPTAYVIATVVGWAGLPLTAWAFSVPIRGLASSVDDKQDLTTWPWLIGTGGLLVLMTLYVLLSPVNDPATHRRRAGRRAVDRRLRTDVDDVPDQAVRRTPPAVHAMATGRRTDHTGSLRRAQPATDPGLVLAVTQPQPHRLPHRHARLRARPGQGPGSAPLLQVWITDPYHPDHLPPSVSSASPPIGRPRERPGRNRQASCQASRTASTTAAPLSPFVTTARATSSSGLTSS